MTSGREKTIGELIGKTIGQWTILSTSSKESSGGNKYLLCRCTCGREFDVRMSTIITGKSLRCSLCAKAENGKRNRKDDFHVASTYILSQYKSNAKNRGIDFLLSREQLESLIK